MDELVRMAGELEDAAGWAYEDCQSAYPILSNQSKNDLMARLIEAGDIITKVRNDIASELGEANSPRQSTRRRRGTQT